MGSVFEVTALKGVNKVGNIKRLDNNYIEVILGALEFPNSIGAVYDMDRAMRFFEPGSIFQRRIVQGFLRGELGHPKEYNCRDYRQYVERIHTIDEGNWAIHIRKVTIVPGYRLPDGQIVTAIIGEVTPTGPNAAVVERILQNPDENLAFSIRSMATDRIVGGKRRKYLDNVITFDVVNEPGISVATKYNAPSCESMDLAAVFPEIIRTMVDDTEKEVALESSLGQTVAAIRAIDRKEYVRNHSSAITRW
ncbi:prohead core protein protease [Serratia phage vB_SmaS-Totoro]|nr:prohead core protein protease [Serratia phage vB_SmaS-Totoro]